MRHRRHRRRAVHAAAARCPGRTLARHCAPRVVFGCARSGARCRSTIQGPRSAGRRDGAAAGRQRRRYPRRSRRLRATPGFRCRAAGRRHRDAGQWSSAATADRRPPARHDTDGVRRRCRRIGRVVSPTALVAARCAAGARAGVGTGCVVVCDARHRAERGARCDHDAAVVSCDARRRNGSHGPFNALRRPST